VESSGEWREKIGMLASRISSRFSCAQMVPGSRRAFSFRRATQRKESSSRTNAEREQSRSNWLVSNVRTPFLVGLSLKMASRGVSLGYWAV
jgi:hypothetical protein